MSNHKQAHPYSLPALFEPWDQLSDVPVCPDSEVIEEDFHKFDSGTPTWEIWHWFEAQHPSFLVGEVLAGVRLAE
jgi:hypothetical protein